MPSETTLEKTPSRRNVLKGAAWAVPVIAVSVATPAAAASAPGGTETNELANYYWRESADADFITLNAAQGGNTAQFSTQIEYRSAPWVNPPAAGVLVVTVVFTEPVTVSRIGSPWTLDGESAGPATTFVFRQAPSAYGGSGLTFDAKAATSGELTATATMGLLNPERPDGSDATCAEESGVATATLVA